MDVDFYWAPFYIYWYNHMIFSFILLCGEFHFDFSDVKPTLHPWDKPNLVI